MGRVSVAVCRTCNWYCWEGKQTEETLKEEAETHSVMLSHDVDFGVSWWLKVEAQERRRNGI